MLSFVADKEECESSGARMSTDNRSYVSYLYLLYSCLAAKLICKIFGICDTVTVTDKDSLLRKLTNSRLLCLCKERIYCGGIDTRQGYA